jgi:hypothetical protein
MAYLDPGSGSYLLQLLLAALFGGLFALRMSWGRVKSFFRRVLRREDDNTDASAGE